MTRFKLQIIVFTVILIQLIALTGCLSDEPQKTDNPDTSHLPYEFTDALGNEVTVSSLDSVVVLYGSFAEAWIDGGGVVTGTTEDAINERNLSLSENVKIVGTVKEPNLEEIIALNPTFVILSADIENHTNIANSLKQMNIPHAFMRIDLFSDYLSMLKIVTDMTGRSDLYEEKGLRVQKRIEEILDKVPKNSDIKVLFLRAYSSGAKAKTDDNFTGIMLEELGTQNIASKYPSLLDELSIEEIILEDPDYIFVTTMGNEEKALNNLEDGIASNPAWKSLKAIKNEKFIVLEKDLYHYKPNSKWANSYEKLAKILYPEIYK